MNAPLKIEWDSSWPLY